MSMYYYEDMGKKSGPFTKDEIKAKELPLDTIIWVDGINAPRKLRDIPVLREGRFLLTSDYNINELYLLLLFLSILSAILS